MLENLLLYLMILSLIGVVLYYKQDRIKKFFSERSDIVVHPNLYSKMVQRGYNSLNSLLYHNTNPNDLKKMIKYTATQRSDGRYIGGYTRESNEFDFHSFQLDYFYDVVNYVEQKNQNFITSLGVTPTQDKLNDIIKSSLDGYDKSILLPLWEDKVFSIESTYTLYQELLNKHGVQLAYLDDDSDTYYLLLYPLAKELEVKEAVLDIGFDYKSMSS